MFGPNNLPGMGKVAMWGLSPACDLLANFPKEKLEAMEEINILLVGQSDIRHSIQTLSKHWTQIKEKKFKLNFYTVEPCLETITRQMLFWALTLEPLKNIGIYEKTLQFMELFGNSLLRPQTKKTLLTQVNRLIKLLVGMNILRILQYINYPFFSRVVVQEASATQELKTLFNFSLMKFRERDGLVEIFKFWKNFSETASFDMSKHWDFRLRHYLNTRYDTRLGVFDWDYHMKLVERGAGIISSGEYKKWRDSGLAFTEYDSHYSQPNLTLVSVASETVGIAGVRSSYWGDIVTGPYICHGLEADDESLYEKANGRYRKQSYDVTYYNLQNIFKILSRDEVEQNENNELNSPYDNVSVHFVSLAKFMSLPTNPNFTNFFHVVYYGNTMVQHMLPHFRTILSSDAIVLTENARYALEFRPEQEELFLQKLNELANDFGLDIIEDVFLDKSTTTGEENDMVKNLRPSILKFMMADADSKAIIPSDTNDNETKNEVSEDMSRISPVNPPTRNTDEDNSGGDADSSANEHSQSSTPSELNLEKLQGGEIN